MKFTLSQCWEMWQKTNKQTFERCFQLEVHVSLIARFIDKLNTLCNTNTSFTSQCFVSCKTNSKMKHIKREWESAQLHALHRSNLWRQLAGVTRPSAHAKYLHSAWHTTVMQFKRTEKNTAYYMYNEELHNLYASPIVHQIIVDEMASA
jgi:hypothetical protein